MNEPKILRNIFPGLETIWETPHECGHCMEHIAEDRLFCPRCGNKLYDEEEKGLDMRCEPELKPSLSCGGEHTPLGGVLRRRA